MTYRAAFELRAVTQLAAPWLTPDVRAVGNEAETGLRAALVTL
ncbi:MAG: hypothetical protein ABIQ53_14950 [Terracoccus sp.]